MSKRCATDRSISDPTATLRVVGQTNWFRPGIEPHDFEFKLRHARRFLEEGDKVKFTLRFRGREMTHPELGERVLTRVKEELAELATIESDVRREGRQMTMLVAPRST